MASGIAFALVAVIANAFAIVLQAAETRRAPLSDAGRPSLLVRLARRPRWLAGTALLVLAWPLQVLALTLAPITVVQPILACTQLVLLLLARTKLREHVGAIEIVGALAIGAGVAAVVFAAPRHTAADPKLAPTVVVLSAVGIAAIVAYAIGRRIRGTYLSLVVGAGFAYAWVDFVNKLLSNELSNGDWLLAILWVAGILAFGALAFLEEMTALQQRPAVTVAPVIGAVQDPLPVLMALVVGAETWSSAPSRVLPLIGGIVLVTLGAVLLGRSRAVARVADADEAL
ncbi:MAG: hypothetical protein JO179_12260 [Solirubrobacterales bacterium]|nr:hypothetical protein [Solirubrobacterales bacterium]